MEGNYLIYDQKILDSSERVLDVSNRAFQYGDGLFESIRIVNGKPCFLKNHIKRLFEGMSLLKLDPPSHFSLEFFEEQISILVARNGIKTGGRVRLSVFRASGGFYLPNNNTASFLLEVKPHKYNRYELNEEGMKIDLFPDIKKPVNQFSLYKTSNALLYVMAGLYAQENELDDCLLINNTNNIIEATSSNIFIVSNGVLYTPALEDGCVGGTMRMNIVNLAIDNNIKVYECSLNSQNLLSADEIFLTNAINGIKWVGSYKQKRYYNKVAKSLLDKLNETVASTSNTNLKLDLQGS
jgi:branched-subunit amino acid aminotransferase/4-amino-4-deoxychorismate lyase